MTENQQEFDSFVERMARIRDLSSPALYDFDSAEDYSKRLKENFETIGRLASENRKMLDEVLFPILESDQKLPSASVEEMSEFGEKLLSLAEDVTDFENLDLPIMSLVTERLARDAEGKDDIANRIRQMDAALVASYSLMNMTGRSPINAKISREYRDRGLEVGDFFLTLIRKENFLTVPDEELRGLVLTDARFVSALYESADEEECKEKNLELLDTMLALADDPFYREAMPDYDWDYYRFRVLGYYLQCTDNGNIRGFSGKQLERILAAADEVEALLFAKEGHFKDITGTEVIPFLCARNRFLAGRLEESDYRGLLLLAYEERDPTGFGPDGNFANVLIPLELLALLENHGKTAEDHALLKRIYQNLSAYMFGMPNAGALSFVMEYFSGIVRRFAEVPSVQSFEEFGLQALAELHPPTYVHSRMVGQLTESLCGHAIELMPETLVGVCGARTAEEVQDKRDEILHFAYHAALCHDFGKILIIDTIFVYGRKLLDFEFDIIKSHPVIGYELLKSHESTRRYAEVALGHHRFYDDSRGYPESFVTAESPDKPIIDLVMCADCMDAATDTVGRSYNRGKTLEDYIGELREGSGTRYAPWLPSLFEREEVRRDLEYLLTTGRQANYRDTFLLLKGVKEKGV